jgi:nucleotide-binding universal stress UspA family protein|tara:strand:- start:480 stop:1457 length:978 start_codon:yes stop_codon:yes gene_type:complete
VTTGGSPEEYQKILEERKKRFRILVYIDGSDECYQSLRYAAKLGRGVDADIILLYVRPVDQGLRSGGLQIRVARENMMDWGLELPGIQYLKKGRDILIELGDMADDWAETATHVDVEGDPLGDNKIEYVNEQGKSIVLKLKTATDIATGILDQYELGPYSMIILGASDRWRGLAKSLWDPAIAAKVAIHAPCSVLIARALEIGRGHLICTDGSERAMDMVRKNAYLASRCECPISLMSVALETGSKEEAQKYVDEAKNMLRSMDIEVEESIVKVGNPVEKIIEAGPDYSLIVVSDTGKSGMQRFFMGSVAFKVMEKAFNSVLIVR